MADKSTPNEEDVERCPVCTDTFLKCHRVTSDQNQAISIRDDFPYCVEDTKIRNRKRVYVHSPPELETEAVTNNE